MSLKAVHICFILSAIILAVGFGFWAIRNYSYSGNLVNLYLGIGSFVSGIAFSVYLFFFIRKMKKVGPS